MFRTYAVRHFCLVAMILIVGAAAQSVAFGRQMAPLRHPVGEKAPDAFIPYMASQPLDQGNRRISRLLISIHSSGFDAMQYFEIMDRWLEELTDSGRFPGLRDIVLVGHSAGGQFAYLADTDPEVITKRYAERPVFYLCGENDNDPNCEALGRSCSAMLQGRHRLERMQWFAAYPRHKYGPTITRRHAFAVVPKVGHYGFGTMTSPAGLKFLFAPIR